MGIFNRPPRIRLPLTQKTYTAPTPPVLPQKPGDINWIGIGLPILGFGLALGLAFMLSGSATGTSFIFFIPFMLAGILAPPLTNLYQSRKYRNALEKGRIAYQAKVNEFTDNFTRAKENEVLERLDRDPEIATCFQMAKKQDSCLGERRPNDDNPDYLSFRVGLGEQKSILEINGIPEFKEDDPFVEQLKQLGTEKSNNLLKGCPILISFLDIGTLGIAGYPPNTGAFCRSAIIHLSTHHWPAEVQFVVVCPQNLVDEWKWLDYLPHRVGFLDDPVISISSQQESLSLLENEIRHRVDINSAKKDASISKSSISEIPLPSLIVIVDHIDNVYEYPALARLLKDGKASGVFGMIICNDEANIPGECGGVFLADGERSIYKQVGAEGIVFKPIDVDYCDLPDAKLFAQELSRIEWLIPAEVTDPPQMVTLLEMFNASCVEDLKILDRWDGHGKYKYMQAPIGRFMPTPDGDLVLNLQDNDLAHGPHGLISGMTGSGKSELLKTIILSLAINHHPYDLNFVLVDYKGGAAFNDLTDLPHVIATVTDIETHANYAERLLYALGGELNRRMQKLIEANELQGLKNLHIDDYRELMVKEPMPRLVIIFDEFAEFKDRHPEQSEQLVSIARRGRSLGIHLILCTQNPGMVVNAQIRQNSKFRICLNVSSSEESRAMIGTPDAWRLPRGRAFFLVDRPVKFQVAYAGRAYLKSITLKIPDNAIFEIKQDGSKELLYPTADTLPKNTVNEGRAIVEHIIASMEDLHLKPPERLLPEPLGEQIFLPDLISVNEVQGWNGNNWPEIAPYSRLPILGVVDQPYLHDQPIYRFNTQKGSGHLLIFGSPGSGKSTILKTIATSIITLNSPLDSRLYVLNLGDDPGWEIFRDSIHFGAIVNRDEREKGDRLLLMIRRIMYERFSIFKNIPVDDLSKYNELKINPKLPELYLIVDGLTERISQSWNELVDTLTEISRVCRPAGIYIIITANNFRDVPTSIYTCIEDRISFRQVERTQLETIVGAVPEGALRNEVGNPCPPGRGLVRGDPVLDFQAALPGYGKKTEDQAKYIKDLIQSINKNCGIILPKDDVEPLDKHYFLQDVVQKAREFNIDSGNEGREILIGLRYDNKLPVAIDLQNDSPTFLIGSQNPKLGKTKITQSWILSLAEVYKPDEVQFVFIDFHSRQYSAFRELPHTLEYVRFKSKVGDVLDRLKKVMEQRNLLMEKEYDKDKEGFDDATFLKRLPIIFIVIDDFDGFRGRLSSEPSIYNKLTNTLIEGEDAGLRLIIAENIGLLASPTSDPVLKRVVRHGCGLLLGGYENMGTFYNNASIPRNQQKNNLQEGRGYLVRRGQVSLIQAGVYWKEIEDPRIVLRDRIQEISKKSDSVAEWPKND